MYGEQYLITQHIYSTYTAHILLYVVYLFFYISQTAAARRFSSNIQCRVSREVSPRWWRASGLIAMGDGHVERREELGI